MAVAESLDIINLIEKSFRKLSTRNQVKGTFYYENQEVKELEFSNDIILAKVQGSESYPYQVTLDFSKPPHDLRCSCPIKTHCKHIAAALLAGKDLINKKAPKTVSKASKIVPFPIDPVKSIDPQVQLWISKVDEKRQLDAPKQDISEEMRSLVFTIKYYSGSGEVFLGMALLKKLKNGDRYAKTGQMEFDVRKLWDYSSGEIKKYCSEEDWNWISEIGKRASDFSFDGTRLSFAGAAEFLKKLIETGRCYLKGQYGRCLQWGAPQEVLFRWDFIPEKDGQKLSHYFPDGQSSILHLDRPCYINETTDTIGDVQFKENPAILRHLMMAPIIPNKDISLAHQLLSEKIPAISPITPKQIKEIIIQEAPKPRIKLKTITIEGKSNYWGKSEDTTRIGADVSFKYGDYTLPFIAEALHKYAPSHIIHSLPTQNNEIIKIQRYFDKEQPPLLDLKSFHWAYSETSSKKQACDFVFEDISNDLFNLALEIFEMQVPELKKRGWEVEIDPSFPIQGVHDSDEWFLETDEENKGQNDWFDVRLGVMIDGERVNMLPMLIKLVQHLTKENQWDDFESMKDDQIIGLTTDDGKMIRVPVGRIRNIAQHLLLEFSKSNGENIKSLRISKWNGAFLAEFAKAEEKIKTRWMGSEELKNFADKIRENAAIESIPPPAGLKCELRSYQMQGLDWLQFLRKSGLNGILADDMGLGKTVQALAHILIEKESGRMTHPTIVIAPTSLMPNWFNEAGRLAPSLKVLVLHGTERRNHFSKIKEYDLILTTYPLLMRDKEFLIEQEFHLMILDEAQVVKNAKTQAYQVIQQIKAKHRLCLSGTPMENHLGELWSLFHLLLPGFLGDIKTFQTVYRKPIEIGKNQSRRDSLAKRIKPFILRRTKQQVALELPEKTEIIQRIELKGKQRDLYEAIRLRAQQKVMSQIQQKGLERSQIVVLDALLKLRQVCCDPRLVKAADIESIEESAKLECLMDLLTQMVEEKRKILIFSQFTSMLALIEEALKEKNITYTILTGETKDRFTPVNEFQTGPAPVMLISLKAGGVGLNLTAADTVIHYDPWWNPAAESQATDRAHRIGQKKAVFVYKFIVSGSLEEKILLLQERKKALVASLMNNNSDIGAQLSMEDLENIFQPLPTPV